MTTVASPVVSPAAHAAGATPLEQAKEAYDKGEKAYKLGKFEEALSLYERAFELKPFPALLFNIGQCQRNLGRWERAAFFYEGYLRDEPKAKNRPAVLDLIAQMNAKVEEDKRARLVVTPVAPAPVVVAPVVVGTPDAAIQPPAVAGAAASVEKPSTPVYKRWYVWTIFGLVVAGGVGAGVGAAAANPSTDYDGLRGTLGMIGGPSDAM